MAFDCNPFPPSQFGAITLTGLSGGGPVSPDANGNINLGGSNVSVVGNAGANTLSFIAPGASGVAWVYNTSPNVQMSVNTGYIDNFADSTVYTLPQDSALGDVLYLVSGLDSGGGAVWRVYLNGNQQIVLGSGTTGIGPTNSGTDSPGLTATGGGASIYLVCSVANTRWVAISIYGTVNAS